LGKKRSKAILWRNCWARKIWEHIRARMT
jgi:hypothetical protein